MFPVDEIEIKRSSCFCSKISSRSNLQARNPARDNMLFLACHQLHWSSFGDLVGSVCPQHDNRIIHILGGLLLLICLLLLLLLVPWPTSIQLDDIGFLRSPPSPAGGPHGLPLHCHRVTCTHNPIGLDLGECLGKFDSDSNLLKHSF